MWHFYGDVEVISLCADCLRLAMTGNQYNCDSLLAIWTPAFPNERHHGQVEKGSVVAKSIGAPQTPHTGFLCRHTTCPWPPGWSFLRIALDAFTFQAGGDLFPRAAGAGCSEARSDEAPFWKWLGRCREIAMLAMRMGEIHVLSLCKSDGRVVIELFWAWFS